MPLPLSPYMYRRPSADPMTINGSTYQLGIDYHAMEINMADEMTADQMAERIVEKVQNPLMSLSAEMNDNKADSIARALGINPEWLRGTETGRFSSRTGQLMATNRSLRGQIQHLRAVDDYGFFNVSLTEHPIDPTARIIRIVDPNPLPPQQHWVNRNEDAFMPAMNSSPDGGMTFPVIVTNNTPSMIVIDSEAQSLPIRIASQEQANREFGSVHRVIGPIGTMSPPGTPTSEVLAAQERLVQGMNGGGLHIDRGNIEAIREEINRGVREALQPYVGQTNNWGLRDDVRGAINIQSSPRTVSSVFYWSTQENAVRDLQNAFEVIDQHKLKISSATCSVCGHVFRPGKDKPCQHLADLNEAFVEHPVIGPQFSRYDIALGKHKLEPPKVKLKPNHSYKAQQARIPSFAKRKRI